VKYMVLMQGPKGDWQKFNTMPAKDIQAHIAFMKRLNTDLSASGELVDAQGLAFPDQGKIVTARPNAPPAVTDGPFPESKEFLAGYWIVDVENEARAVAIAAHVSTAPGRDGVPLIFPVQVRQVMSAPPEVE
jgi:hypothetical protein